MSSLPLAPTAPTARRSRLRIYALETRAEFLKLLRNPGFLVPTLAFPLAFYALFGLTFAQRVSQAGIRVPVYLIATYGCFGVIGVSLFGFGVSIAQERSHGWLTLKRISPMPPEALLLARMLTATLFNVVLILLLFALGAVLGKAELPLATWLSLGAVLLLGSLPFSALGLALGYMARAQSVPSIANLIYLPISFASGLWMPLYLLPRPFQVMAPFLPPYHFGQLALAQLGAESSSTWAVHAAALAAFTVLFMGLALFGYKRSDARGS